MFSGGYGLHFFWILKLFLCNCFHVIVILSRPKILFFLFSFVLICYKVLTLLGKIRAPYYRLHTWRVYRAPYLVQWRPLGRECNNHFVSYQFLVCSKVFSGIAQNALLFNIIMPLKWSLPVSFSCVQFSSVMAPWLLVFYLFIYLFSLMRHILKLITPSLRW